MVHGPHDSCRHYGFIFNGMKIDILLAGTENS